jgi:CheY-like chemotaxis protein
MPNWLQEPSNKPRSRIRWYGSAMGWRRSTTFLHVVNMPQGTYNDLPVFVLLDLNIPKISGLKVLEAIRTDARTRHLPVIILTSSGEERDRLGAYNHFANSYVIKPLDYDQFVAAALQLSLYWTDLNEPAPLIPS